MAVNVRKAIPVAVWKMSTPELEEMLTAVSLELNKRKGSELQKVHKQVASVMRT